MLLTFSLQWNQDKSQSRGQLSSSVLISVYSEHLCSLVFLLDCKRKSQELCFHLSATKNKSYLTADSKRRRVKNTSVKHFISLLLPCIAASRTWHRRGTQSPSCPSRADSALTWTRKTEVPFFSHLFSMTCRLSFAQWLFHSWWEHRPLHRPTQLIGGSLSHHSSSCRPWD